MILCFLSVSTLFSFSFDTAGHSPLLEQFSSVNVRDSSFYFSLIFLSLFAYTFKEGNIRLLCSWSLYLLFLQSSSCLIPLYKKSTTNSLLAVFQFHVWLLFGLWSGWITVTRLIGRNLHLLQIFSMTFYTILNNNTLLYATKVCNLNNIFLFQFSLYF